MKWPMISIVIPVYNGEKTIESCLKSILTQTYSNFEVIVVDNNSNDKSKEIILSFTAKFKRIRYFFEKKRGRGAARNTGILNSSGQIIAMTDCDCVTPNDWLYKLTKFIIIKNEQACQGFEKDKLKNFWSQEMQKTDVDFMQRVKIGKYINHIDTKNFAINAELIKKIMFDSNVKNLEDLDLYLRIKNMIKIAFAPSCYVFHLHTTSFTQTVKKNFDRGYWIMEIFRKHRNDKGIGNEPMIESITLKNFITFPVWIILQCLKKRPSSFFFLLTSEFSWRIGILASRINFKCFI